MRRLAEHTWKMVLLKKDTMGGVGLFGFEDGILGGEEWRRAASEQGVGGV